jgi:FkbM family methyltransferase
MIKRFLLSAVRKMGYELTPRQDRGSIRGVLVNAQRNGLSPASIIDVGAGRGDFSRLAAELFPQASILMIEPLEEFASSLVALTKALPKSRVTHAVAGPKEGKITLNVHPDLFGSSLLREDEDSDVNGQPRDVLAVTLDTEVASTGMTGPYLLKVDVQGAELGVLEGAQQILRQSQLVLLETSLFNFFQSGPLLHEVVAWMAERGFVPYDMLGLARRPLDGALAQVDVAFVPKDSPLRRQHHYATAEQRAQLTKRLRS